MRLLNALAGDEYCHGRVIFSCIRCKQERKKAEKGIGYHQRYDEFLSPEITLRMQELLEANREKKKKQSKVHGISSNSIIATGKEENGNVSNTS